MAPGSCHFHTSNQCSFPLAYVVVQEPGSKLLISPSRLKSCLECFWVVTDCPHFYLHPPTVWEWDRERTVGNRYHSEGGTKGWSFLSLKWTEGAWSAGLGLSESCRHSAGIVLLVGDLQVFRIIHSHRRHVCVWGRQPSEMPEQGVRGSWLRGPPAGLAPSPRQEA